MAVQTLKLAGREFVILPKREYSALKARANGSRKSKERRLSRQDIGDLAEIERLKRDPAERPIPWSEVRKRL